MVVLQRPNIVEKLNYEPASLQEEFIVPLLRQHIEWSLATYAVSTSLERCVIDVGCGRQPFRKNLESLGYSYTSFDVQQNPEGTVDVVGAIDQLLPEKLTTCKPFDFVLCTEVMEHVVDWNTAFKNLATLMAPGGRLLITCPHFYPLHEEPYDFWRPTPHALKFFALQVGFNILHQENVGNAWDVLGTLLGSCRATPVSSHLLHRGATKLVSICQKWLLKLLIDRRIQQAVNLHSLFYPLYPIYLSNVIVLEKS